MEMGFSYILQANIHEPKRQVEQDLLKFFRAASILTECWLM